MTTMRFFLTSYILGLSTLLLIFACSSPESNLLTVQKDGHVVLIGNNLGSRMMNYGFFETELQLRYPDSLLVIRNMCDGGNTPGFRPHSGRVSPWAFPGATQFYSELATNSGSQGHFKSPDQWLSNLQADLIIAFFGYNESFQGEEGIDLYKNELEAFIAHTFSQQYNGHSPPQLALVSPIAFQDLSSQFDLPNGQKENTNLSLYAAAMKEVAEQNNVLFVDAFTTTKNWFDESELALTIDGSQLNETGYQRFSSFLVDQLFGKTSAVSNHFDLVHEAVM